MDKKERKPIPMAERWAHDTLSADLCYGQCANCKYRDKKHRYNYSVCEKYDDKPIELAFRNAKCDKFEKE